MGALVSFGFAADRQIWKSANCATHTATLNRSVLGRPGYMLRCTRRCRAPTVRRLERLYGKEKIRSEYEQIAQEL